jgi:hypothetical protein
MKLQIILCIHALALSITSLNGASVWQIVYGNFSWEDAKADAVSRGGRLAVLNTTDKIADFNNYLDALGTWPEMFIGLTDEETEGVWKWVNGEPLTASNWTPGEPNNAYHPWTGPEHYAVVVSSNNPDHAGTWGDNGATYFSYAGVLRGDLGGYVLETVPEPSSMALTIFFGLGIGMRRTRVHHDETKA